MTNPNTPQELPELPSKQYREHVMRNLVDRFLMWPLPDNVCVDLCATYPGAPHRSGTNLLDCSQTRAMLEHVVGPTIDGTRLMAFHESRRANVAETDLATARAEIDKAQQEIARLNMWADSFTDAHLKERQTGDALIKELRQEITQLRATPTAPADLVEALRGAIRIMRDFDSGDPECEHGMFYDVCPNVECEKRDFHKVLESAKSTLSRYSAAHQEPCCSSPRPDCMGMLVEGIGNRCQAMKAGD